MARTNLECVPDILQVLEHLFKASGPQSLGHFCLLVLSISQLFAEMALALRASRSRSEFRCS